MFKTIFVVLEAFIVLCCLKRTQRATSTPSMPSCCEERKNLPQAMDDIGREDAHKARWPGSSP